MITAAVDVVDGPCPGVARVEHIDAPIDLLHEMSRGPIPSLVLAILKNLVGVAMFLFILCPLGVLLESCTPRRVRVREPPKMRATEGTYHDADAVGLGENGERAIFLRRQFEIGEFGLFVGGRRLLRNSDSFFVHLAVGRVSAITSLSVL
jgi:hypothetical protein